MKRMTTLVMILLALVGGRFASAQAADDGPAQLTATQIVERSQLAFHYQGDDMKSKVTMTLISKDGSKRVRVLTMLRRDEAEGGKQKFFIYFHEPGEVRRMTFLVWKDPDKEDDRWLYIPAVDLIRQIAADDKRSSFVGSDFTYEDISGRDVTADTHRFLREETLDGRDAYVVESLPKANEDYTKRLSWIDKATFLPLKEEYYDAQDELFRVFTADKIEEVPGEKGGRYPTVTQRTMTNVKTGHRTTVAFEAISYDLGLKDGDFSERRMRRPPRSWIQ